MASSFLTGLGTGFFGTIGDRIDQRQQAADEYFQERMETARKIANRNRSVVNERVQSYTTEAKRLESLGVPKDMVMQIANQDPDSLSSVYKEISDLQMRGAKPSPEFFSSLIKVHGQVNPEESYSDFFRRAVGPVKRNMEADPDSFEIDPAGSIFASIMGYNAMEKATQRLDDSMIDGSSASDWLSMEGNEEAYNPPAGDAYGAIDWNAAGDTYREVTTTDKPVSPVDIIRLEKMWDDREKELVTEYSREPYLMDIDTAKEQARIQTGKEFAQRAAQNESIARILPDIAPEKQMYLSYEEPSTNTETTPSPVTETPPPVVEESSQEVKLPNGDMLVRDNGDGTSVWKTSDGKEVTRTFDEVYQLQMGKTSVTNTEPKPTNTDNVEWGF